MGLTAHPGVLALLLLSLPILHRLFRKRIKRPPYPPGPKGSLLLGNLLDIPSFKAWFPYMEMAKKYSSDIIHFSVLGQHLIVLNSLEASVELLEKRAKIYSSRPNLPILDLMGWLWFVPLLPYGDSWRHSRRIFQQKMRKEITYQFEPLILKHVREFLRNLSSSLDDPARHLRRLGAIMSMQFAYDIDIKPPNDHFYKIAEEAIAGGAEVLLPGHALVNELPFLRHLPKWIPGLGFQKAVAVKKLTDELRDGTYALTRSEMAKGNYTSLLARLLEENDVAGGSKEQEEVIKGMAATIYIAGNETTATATETFFYQMGRHPEIQRKAQAEIDRVVGNHRLPDFSDRPSMPYIDAIYHELLRLRPVFPLGLPHSSVKDDVYSGYFIPKGSIVIANLWAITRDENVYPDADKCRPERFLDANGQLKNETILAYGFGRRICPGRYVASSTLWLMIASVLATFTIHKWKDDTGNEEEEERAYTDGPISRPLFKVSLTLRSQDAIRLIEESR